MSDGPATGDDGPVNQQLEKAKGKETCALSAFKEHRHVALTKSGTKWLVGWYFSRISL
jgi:hypothetical protein